MNILKIELTRIVFELVKLPRVKAVADGPFS